MRNEELETRLHRMTEKVWSLKMICLEQQKHLKRQTVDRQAMAVELRICKDKAVENMLFCKQHYYETLE